jgi:hypothetical protein
MKIKDCIDDCVSSYFWGDLNIRFKNGIPIVVTKTEQFVIAEEKPTAVSRKNHQCHDSLGDSHGQRKKSER